MAYIMCKIFKCVPIIGSLLQIIFDPLSGSPMQNEFYNEWKICDRNAIKNWMKYYKRVPTILDCCRILKEKSKWNT